VIKNTNGDTSDMIYILPAAGETSISVGSVPEYSLLNLELGDQFNEKIVDGELSLKSSSAFPG